MTQTPFAETQFPSIPHYENIDEEAAALNEADLDTEADTDAEVDDQADDQDEPDEVESADAATGGARTVAAKPNKAFIRRVAAKALEVEAAAGSTRVLAAALLGTGEDTVDLVAAIMTAGRGVGQPLTDIAEILTALTDEPWEAGVTATALDATRQKAVWSLLHAREAVGAPTPPKSQQKAGSAIVKAINGLTEADKTGLTAAGDLLKRS